MERNEDEIDPLLGLWPIVWIRIVKIRKGVELVSSVALDDILAVRFRDGILRLYSNEHEQLAGMMIIKP